MISLNYVQTREVFVLSSLPTQWLNKCKDVPLWSFSLEEKFHILDYYAYINHHGKIHQSKHIQKKVRRKDRYRVGERECVKILRECEKWRSVWHPAVDLQVLQVFLDAPQSVGALLQLSDFFVGQGHVDDAAHSAAVEHTGQTQVHFVSDAIHALQMT